MVNQYAPGSTQSGGFLYWDIRGAISSGSNDEW